MRLFCRENHDVRDIPTCPPHDFEGGWTAIEADGSQRGVIYCRACGDIRELNPPSIEPTTLEIESRNEASK